MTTNHCRLRAAISQDATPADPERRSGPDDERLTLPPDPAVWRDLPKTRWPADPERRSVTVALRQIEALRTRSNRQGSPVDAFMDGVEQSAAILRDALAAIPDES